MQTRKILIVDDEPDVLETLEVCLRVEGYEVMTAENGVGGLEAALTQKLKPKIDVPTRRSQALWRDPAKPERAVS